ncbi:MAG: Ger(x)C family spore germination C-terminal domain-containing protein [Clostridiales bacterium]|nr:Ger(x)C family spore germination C-terminal domain-containing protein [Clostridiales bacterium]
MLKKINLIITAFVLGLLLSACSGSYDLEDRAFATAIAADWSADEGYQIIVSLPSLDKDEALTRTTRSAQAPALKEAMAKIDRNMTKRIYYGHTKAVILGADLLRSRSAMTELADYLADNVQIDKNLIITGAYNIEEIMSLEPEEDKLTGFYISSFYDSGNEQKTFVNKETLLDLLKDRSEGVSAAVPLLSAVDDEPTFTGIAVLKNGSLCGILEQDAAYGFMWLTDKSFNGTLTSQAPAVSTEIMEKETSYAFYEEEGELCAGAVIDVQGNMWNFTDDEIKSKASEYLSVFKNKIADQAQAALAELSKMDCDPLNLSDLLKENNPELYEKYKGAVPSNVNISVNLSLNFV